MTQPNSGHKQREHASEHAKRAARLDRGVYGTVQKSVLPRHVWVHHEPPSYLASSRTCRLHGKARSAGVDIGLDRRCFFTGVRVPPDDPKRPVRDRDVRKAPWLGTKDHLVPLRRGVDIWPAGLQANAFVWSSNVANVTLGLVPLFVRLKVRQWLSDAPFDRGDLSVEAGQNVRWLIIEYLDHFRIDGRFPWSRDIMGRYWLGAMSEDFMARMRKAEEEFLRLSEDERDAFVRDFTWFF